MDESRVLSAKSQKSASKHIHFGNVISVSIAAIAGGVWALTDNFLWMIPMVIPLVLWFGLSMLVFAFHRHHPNPKVQHYTMIAGRWYYALISPVAVVGAFIPKNEAATILGTAFIVIALTLYFKAFVEIRKINNDDWQDILLPVEN